MIVLDKGVGCSVNKTMLHLVERFNGKQIMVIGDMVADVYVEGKISRISREAPVLILEHMAETVVPGGAANAVNNTAALGGSVYAVGVVGQDFAGEELRAILVDKGVNTEGLCTDANRPTITKTRIMAGGHATVRQQVVRIDRLDNTPLGSTAEKTLLAYMAATIGHMDAVVLSDYGNQTISPVMINAVVHKCTELDIPCIVDSRYNVMAYPGVTVVKQNEFEAATALGYAQSDADTIRQAGQAMLTALAAQAVLITRGPDGMSLFERGGTVTDIPVTNISKVYDVTGAGDTVVAAMILAMTAGASYSEAARLANYTAGVVVRKPGTATVSPAELYAAIEEEPS